MEIYTDGACQGKERRYGGWAAIFLEDNEKIKEISGYELDTTNQRMELQAALEALKAIPEGCSTVKLYSDSSYMVNAFKDDWFKSWKGNNWKTKAGTDVKNQDLWKPLEELARKHKVEFVFVKGHASNPHNNYCDKLAVREALKGKAEINRSSE